MNELWEEGNNIHETHSEVSAHLYCQTVHKNSKNFSIVNFRISLLVIDTKLAFFFHGLQVNRILHHKAADDISICQIYN